MFNLKIISFVQISYNYKFEKYFGDKKKDIIYPFY